MALRQQVADLHADVRKLIALLEGHPTASDLAKVHDEVKAGREDMAGVATATQTALRAVTENLAGVLARAADLAGAPVPKAGAAPKVVKAATPTVPGKENS